MIDSTSRRPAWQLSHSELDQQLLVAHASEDKVALISLYTQAADTAERHGDIDAARFYLTHAYIFALDVGHSEPVELQQRLDAYHASTRT